MLKIIFYLMVFLTITACDSLKYKKITSYGEQLSLVKDNHDDLYFRYTTDRCGSKYWYNDTIYFDNGKANLIPTEYKLNQVMELATFKLKRLEMLDLLYYRFEDKHYNYTLRAMKCDYYLSFSKK